MTVIFARINFRVETTNRFREFSKELDHTHTETLEAMMDFFVQYKINPFGDLGKDLHGLELNLKKRINALIAIVKDIEKHQTGPTTAMMQLIFEQAPKPTQSHPSQRESQTRRNDNFFATAQRGIELERENTQLQQELNRIKNDMELLLKNAKISTRGLGKPKIILELPKEEFERIQLTYKAK
ncbi:hypothetical protein K1F50_15745 [Muricauda oceani]|uniref:Uncharacterized protein n=1 Tax=Flagellimonas oceani TaxID=2698672 RepID=A0A6G7J0C8_9FLAO|nr:BfmA/BtgA family mobilization protein [Allomuricauda oceani]MBW8244262.1 hypothetical protein [Allomuricauda oceani]QII44089.1 hypothetical protein GVT53_05185 [Allomuricauda oceani]